MADTTILIPLKRYVFDSDYTASQFQEFQTPPVNNTNRTFLKGTTIDAVGKRGFDTEIHLVTSDGYDVTPAVSPAPDVIVTPPVVMQVSNPSSIRKPELFSKGEKTVIFVVILILVIIIIANEAK